MDIEHTLEKTKLLAEFAGIPPTDVGLDAEKARQLETTWLGDFGSRAVSGEDPGRMLAELRPE